MMISNFTSLWLSLLTLPASMALHVFDVAVGRDGLVYTPEYVNASPGDIVNFVFHPKNHTVTQNSFEAPCVPLTGGVSSGFMSVPVEVTGLPNFPFIVKDTNPTWFHCEQTGHCGQGMVFAVNPPPDPNSHSFSAEKALAIAINGTSSSKASGNTTSKGVTTNHMVTVGKDDQLRYDPQYITAAVGDTVTYQFFPKNHSVTQSNFAEPCQPKADTSSDHMPGFDSGFTPVAASDTTPHLFTITVNDTNPIWAYCRQVGHCGSGMVMAINPPSSGNTFEAFQTLAEKINGTSSNASTKATITPTTMAPTNHMVTVGKDGQLRYDPQYITAAVGDTVTYQFFPKNHTVTQSNFAEPCQPKADTSSDHVPGFDSGFTPIAPDDTAPHLFTITVNDTSPLWVYCRQVGHCGSGMVMAINPPSTGNTFDAFQALAEKINGTSSASATAATGPSTYASSPSPSSGSTAKGALDNTVVGSSSIDVSGLTRNTYIIIGLLSAVLLGLIILAVFMLFQRNRGYKAVPKISSRSAEILPYTQKGPYSTPYSTADAEEYRD